MPIEQYRTPQGGITQRLTVDVPGFGLRCICYPDMDRKDIAPIARPYTMETRIGTTRWSCNCNNRSPGSQVPLEAMASIIPSAEFKAAAKAAIQAEVGGGFATGLTFVEEKEERRRINLPVLGGALLLLGAATGWYFFSKVRSRNPGLFTQWDAKNIARKRGVRPELVEAVYTTMGQRPKDLHEIVGGASAQLRRERGDLDWPMVVTSVLFGLEDGGYVKLETNGWRRS
jgi:hypothetical protein